MIIDYILYFAVKVDGSNQSGIVQNDIDIDDGEDSNDQTRLIDNENNNN